MFKIFSFFCILSVAFLLSGCTQEDVKIVKKSYFKTKLGTFEDQKLITKLPEIKKPIIVKKKRKKENPTVQQKKQPDHSPPL